MARILHSIAAGVAAAALALSPPVQAQQKLKIGFITTLSGPPAIIGKHMKDSVEVALEHLGGKRSEEHTSELQSPCNLVCRLLLEKKKKSDTRHVHRISLSSSQDSQRLQTFR